MVKTTHNYTMFNTRKWSVFFAVLACGNAFMEAQKGTCTYNLVYLKDYYYIKMYFCVSVFLFQNVSSSFSKSTGIIFCVKFYFIKG